MVVFQGLRLSLLLIFALLASLPNATAFADFDARQLQNRIFATIETVKPAVVSVGQRGGTFSGVIVSRDGHVLSAGHAVRPGGRYQVTLPDGRRLTARGKGSNPLADCALLKITSKTDELPFVEMGESKGLVRNQPCLSVSFPGGQGTRGVPLVRFGRIVQTSRRGGMFQSTALMEPGDSGGALFDLQGRVIGIHSRIGTSMRRNYEVPVDTYKKFWNELNREEVFTQSGPPIPKLGFRGMGLRDGSGIEVANIFSGTLASKHGIQAEDIIKTVYGQQTPSIADLRKALVAARDEGAEEIVVTVLREEEELDLNMPFEVVRKAAPTVDLPKYSGKEFSQPVAIEELTNLPKQFAALESELDDGCVEISSMLDEEEVTIRGTLIRNTAYIVSKSSMVHHAPTTELSATDALLEVVARDNKNDLVLLRSPTTHETGVDLNNSSDSAYQAGLFLLTPDPRGQGTVSIVSREAFESRKEMSRGFLGVMPADYKDRAGAILREVNEDGAAERAGLEVGDVVTKLNDQPIRTHMEMRRFLGTVDPNETIIAVVLRGEEELQKTIRLGAFPSFSGHAADRMEKSGRRDGFSQVISHDADLAPSDCGGPLYDLSGQFLGLNIARNSRVRSYAITPTIVKELVEQH
ncbi:MAG: trypsin-like peptidase domain-containing protein [Aureliella sp.]